MSGMASASSLLSALALLISSFQYLTEWYSQIDGVIIAVLMQKLETPIVATRDHICWEPEVRQKRMQIIRGQNRNDIYWLPIKGQTLVDILHVYHLITRKPCKVDTIFLNIEMKELGPRKLK